jgi:PTH1 family peptidyl-tRNA hydrolase
MKLIIGLGNPDEKYKKTRHNLGQMIVQYFIANKNISLKSFSKLSAQLAETGQGSTEKILIGITNEYMNNSGIAVKKIADFFKIDPKDIYVIHDDLDLEIGDYKIQFDRGAAGHNGIKSIIEHMGTKAFNRIRIGIGHPQNNIPVEEYVLLPFSKEEKVIIDSTIPKIIDEINKIISH